MEGSTKNKPERRDFLKASAQVLGGAVASGFPAVISGQTVSGAIKVGLVGCGGRGTGAAAQALAADDQAELTALADVDRGQIANSIAALKKLHKISDRVKVDERNWFLGTQAYQQLIESGVDVVVLATPPGFRPLHLAACVAGNKHIFCEKPAAVDAFGVRSVLESTQKASEKSLSLVAGFCWRYNNMLQETMRQIHEGVIGKMVAYYATYYTNPLKVMPPESARPPGVSDMEWQIRNWYNFVWLSGDSLVEQAVHSADKIAWAMRDEAPVSCVGIGGRVIPAEGGNIYDHFEVNYLYPNGARAFLASRQIEGCYNENSDYVLGSDGTATFGRGPIARIAGKTNWAWAGQTYNMYQREHDVLFAAIRQGKPVNDGKRLATSTMLAIMGRMAAYTGQQVSWEQAFNSQEKLFPDQVDWKGSFPVRPRAMPGITKLV